MEKYRWRIHIFNGIRPAVATLIVIPYISGCPRMDFLAGISGFLLY